MKFVHPSIIVERARYNRILDASHGGRRDLLLSAVTAYNQLPRRSTGVSPETLWRSLRPPQARWRQRSLTATTGEVTNITDAEWLAFLDEHAQLTPAAYAAAAQDFQKDLGELQNLLQSQAERSKLAQRVQRSKKTTKADTMPLLSGDIVLTRSTQYRSSCGHGKFESNADGLKTFRVLHISGQIAVLKDETTGAELQKHVSLLKAMPRVLPASCAEPMVTSPQTKRKLQELQCIGPFWLVTAEADGGCLFRSMAMGRQWLHGVRPHLLQDNKANAAQLRLDVVQFASAGAQDKMPTSLRPCRRWSRPSCWTRPCGTKMCHLTGPGSGVSWSSPPPLLATSLCPCSLRCVTSLCGCCSSVQRRAHC